MKWFKKWSFFCCLILSGILFLAIAFLKESGFGRTLQFAISIGANSVSKIPSNEMVPFRLFEIDFVTRKALPGDLVGNESKRQHTKYDDEMLQTPPYESDTQGAESSDTTEDTPIQELLYRDPSEVTYESVTDTYFEDALFLGDSRTVGMYDYGGLENTATFYASTGLTVYKIFDAKIVPQEGTDEKLTVEEGLQQNKFSKIYLMIGINEMGTGTVETFLAKYAEVVAHIRELQPDAILYLESIMKVSTKRSEQGDYINNAGIEARNEGIANLCDNVWVYYLDVNSCVCDAEGGLEESYTFDGVHLKARYISIWKEFLMAHAVSLD
ncbi:MAG: GDSL-type esterase/lipase family protein [Lachnospiraceae bacterium]|nr:GDSL-type esterase/lipase family protein [Lachnospiraceae bacterium]